MRESRSRPPRHDPFARFGVTKPTQLITKSDQWFEEVEFLLRHERFSALLYLGGFVIECLLKAAMWNRRFEPKMRPLIYRSHDLDGLLSGCPNLVEAIRRDRAAVREHFAQVAGWHIGIRYNPRRVHRRDAEAFVWHLREVRQWVRSRV